MSIPNLPIDMTHARATTRTTATLLALGAALHLAGCASSISPRCDESAPASADRNDCDFGQFDPLPKYRLGSLPFPGPFTLYAKADPNDLGDHTYDPDPFDSSETPRGIIYTCRAGFLDLSHLRTAADLVGYIHARVDLAISRGWSCVQFRTHEPSIYTVRFDDPTDWDATNHAQRAALERELSIRIAQRLAFTAMTWHELLTWYGYRSTVIFPEHDSAFTYEDSVSHAVGVLAAGNALRSSRPFDEALTIALEQMLNELHPVSREDLDDAVDAVRGSWWDNGAPLKRDLDTPLGTIDPWLVPDLPCCAGAQPAALELPSLADVAGRDLTGFYTLTIQPNVLETAAIRDRLDLDPPPDEINPERDFPTLLADIRESLGPENTRPDAPTSQAMR